MIKNWKYKNWETDILTRCSEKDFPFMQTYINWEILPEHLEIMINILRPRLFEYKDSVFCNLYDENDQPIKDIVDKADSRSTKSELQASINRFDVRDIFFNNSDNSTDETINNIAELIKHNWEYHLQKEYPDRKFIVEIGGEAFEPWISFYEVPLK